MNYNHKRIHQSNIAQNVFNNNYLSPFIEFQCCCKLFIPKMIKISAIFIHFDLKQKILNAKLDLKNHLFFNVEKKMKRFQAYSALFLNLDVFHVVIVETVFLNCLYFFTLQVFSSLVYVLLYFFMISTSYIYTVMIGTNFNPFSTSATD